MQSTEASVAYQSVRVEAHRRCKTQCWSNRVCPAGLIHAESLHDSHLNLGNNHRGCLTVSDEQRSRGAQ